MDDAYSGMPGTGSCVWDCTVPEEEGKHKEHKAFKQAPATSQN